MLDDINLSTADNKTKIAVMKISHCLYKDFLRFLIMATDYFSTSDPSPNI